MCEIPADSLSSCTAALGKKVLNECGARQSQYAVNQSDVRDHGPSGGVAIQQAVHLRSLHSQPAGGSRGPRFCRSKPSILIGTQERPHRLHHARKSKALFRTPVGSARRLCHHRDRRGLAARAATPYSRQSPIRRWAACSCSPASSQRCRRNRRIAPTPTVPGLAGGPNRCSPQPGRGPVSLRRPSNSNRSVGRYLFTRTFKRTASTVLRCRFAPAKGSPPLAPPDETRPGGLLGGSAAMQSSQSRRGRTVYPLNREETP